MATTPKTKDKHPYMSGTAGMMQLAAQFRKSFPAQVSADTLKKLSIAPNNESYLLNVLRFLGVLDAEGKKTESAAAAFNQHDDADFQDAFGKLVKSAYADLFSLHGDAAWSLPASKLISFFRNTDHTSGIVGGRQASTFQALSSLSGQVVGSTAKSTQVKSPKTKAVRKEVASQRKQGAVAPAKVVATDASDSGAGTLKQPNQSGSDVGLTVRIEINLPASGDQDTYDRIFKSIRENLLNAKST